MARYENNRKFSVPLLLVYDETAKLKNVFGKIIRGKKSIEQEYSGDPDYEQEPTIRQWERLSQRTDACLRELN